MIDYQDGQKKLHSRGVPVRMVPVLSVRFLLEITSVLLVLFIGLMSMLYLHGKKIAELEERTQQHLSQLARSQDAIRNTNGEVLGEVLQATDQLGPDDVATPNGRLIVNVPSEFNSDVIVRGQALLYDLIGGDGISILADDTGQPTVVNADPGSAQNIFKTIRIGDKTFSAGNNEAELILEGLDGLTVDVDETTGTITLSAEDAIDEAVEEAVASAGTTTQITEVTEQTIIEDDDGLTDTGTTITLETATDNVAFGTANAAGKLTVHSNTANQIGLVVEAAPGQTANVSEWRNENGETKISFDQNGNATFGGTIISADFGTDDNELTFSGDATNLVFDINTAEPENLLLNPGLDVNLDNWQSSLPSGINQANNPGFETNISGWNSSVPFGSYAEEYTNTGFEVNLDDWDIDVGNTLTILEQSLPTGTSPQFMTTGPAGDVWFTIFDSDQIGRITPDMVITEYDLPVGQDGPNDITLGSDGRIWYTLYNSDQIGALDPTAGSKANIEASMTVYSLSAGGASPNMITTGPNGNIWYTEHNGKRTRKVDPGTGALLGTVAIDNGGFTWHSDIVAGPDGNVWAMEYNHDELLKIDPDTVTYSVLEFGVNIDRMEVGPNNLIYLYSTNEFDRKIYSINPFAGSDAAIVASLQQVASPPYPSKPNDMTVGPGGKWWVPANANNWILRYESDFSSYTTFNTPTASSLPFAITQGGDSNLYVTLRGTNAIAKVVLNQPERVTSPTHNFSDGALEVNASNNITVTQSKTLLGSTQYNLETHVYIDGSTAVTTNDAQLYVNGNTVPTTVTSTGSGWYKLTATVSGSGTPIAYGLVVKGGAHVYVDDFSLKRVSGAFHTFSQFYTTFGSSKIDAPPASDAFFTQQLPFLSNTYSLSMYAYKDGSALTTADAQLYFNGAAIPTTISSTGKAGWYQLMGTFTTGETSASYGVNIKAGRSIYVDDVSILVGSFDSTVDHTTLGPFEGTGAVRINAIGTTDINYFQEYTVEDQDSFILYTYLYNDTPGSEGTPPTTSNALLTINGNPTSQTSFVPIGGGWYQAIAPEFTLNPGSYNVGVEIQSGYRMKVDSFVFQAGSGSNKTLAITNTGSGLAFLSVESTTTIGTGKATEEGLIIVGSANQEENLTEWQDSNNNILAVVDADGDFGIGTDTPSQALTIIDDQSNTAAAAIVNPNATDTTTVEVLRLSTGANPVGTDTRFTSFYAEATDETDGTLVGKIRLNNNGVAYDTSSADFGEYFSSERPGEEYEPGTVVSLNDRGRADTTVRGYADGVLGVVSDTAGFVGNARPDTEATGAAYVLVGVLGQIDTNVTDMNGPIRAGDKITSSMIEGHGMKATEPGMVLGVALEDFEGGAMCEGVESTGTESIGLGDSNSPIEETEEQDAEATAAAELSEDGDEADGEADLTEQSNSTTPSYSCGTIKVYVNTSWKGAPGYVAGQEGSITGAFIAGSASVLGSQTSTQNPLELLTTTEEEAIIEGGLTVMGEANIYDLSVTNSITSGLLTINGLQPDPITGENSAAIDTITGALLLQSQAQGAIEFMGNKIRFDQDGNLELRKGGIVGNTRIAGTVTVPAGETSIAIDQSWTRTPLSIIANPMGKTPVSWTIDDSSTDGFTIRLAEPQPGDIKFSWFVIFAPEEEAVE